MVVHWSGSRLHEATLRASQICVNMNNANAEPNKIASGLQSLMKQDVAHLDMLFLAQFLGPIPQRLSHETL
jgi:hypothetical protein